MRVPLGESLELATQTTVLLFEAAGPGFVVAKLRFEARLGFLEAAFLALQRSTLFIAFFLCPDVFFNLPQGFQLCRESCANVRSAFTQKVDGYVALLARLSEGLLLCQELGEGLVQLFTFADHLRAISVLDHRLLSTWLWLQQ